MPIIFPGTSLGVAPSQPVDKRETAIKVKSRLTKLQTSIDFDSNPSVFSIAFQTLFDYNKIMVVSKQVADMLTGFRGLIALVLAWVGLTQGADGLYLAAWLLLLAWISDGLDGPLARHSRRQYRSWLGDHDLQIDMAVSAGLFVYLFTADLITPVTAGFYLLIWAVIFARWGFNHSLGMLVQAPVYGRFLWIVRQAAPGVGAYLVGWITALVIITWPRFPQQVIPDFLKGIQSLRLQHTDYHADQSPPNEATDKLIE